MCHIGFGSIKVMIDTSFLSDILFIITATQGKEATNERITRLESAVKHLQNMITDMELVLMEVTEHFESKTDLSDSHF